MAPAPEEGGWQGLLQSVPCLTGKVVTLPDLSWVTHLPPQLGKLRRSRSLSYQELQQQGGIPIWSFAKSMVPSGRCVGRCGAVRAH